jgi:hypothetical protein
MGRGQDTGIILEPKQRRRGLRDQIPDDGGGKHDQRERQRKEKDANIGRRREAEQHRSLECAFADADERFEHDHQHGRLDAEQRPVHKRDAASERIEQAQP